MTVEHEQPVMGRLTNELCQRIDDEHYRVDGRVLSLPMEIADASLVLNIFDVNAAAAQRLLEGTGLTAACALPGRALLLLMGVAYRDNPLGAYREVAVLLSAHPPGETKRSWISGSLASLATLDVRVPFFVYRMPVDQEFTTHAGRFVWGYPKYLAEIELAFQDRRARTRLTQDQRFVLSFQAPAVRDAEHGAIGGVRLRDRTAWNLTWRDGQLRRVPAIMGGAGIAWRLGGSPPELDEHHPLALALRTLGLPKRPLLSASATHVHMRMGAPDLLTP